jgi:hypothetical protein
MLDVKHLWRVALNGLTALLALLCAAIFVSWVHSAHGQWRRSLSVRGSRYHFTSQSAVLFVDGPPAAADDPAAKRIAAQMSNDDFLWNQKPAINAAGARLITGDVRKGSPTWEMYEHFRKQIMSSTGLEPGRRLWLAALDDPRKYLSAEWMLALSAGNWRIARGSYTGAEVLTVPADPVTGMPDLSNWKSHRDQWHDRFDVRRGTFPYGLLLAMALTVPVARLSYPAARNRNLIRWMCNAAALGSLCLAAIVGVELRVSYGPGEDVELKNETVPSPFAGGYYSTQLYTHFIWLRSYKGRVQLLERSVPQSAAPSRSTRRPTPPFILSLPAMYRSVGTRVTHQWSWLGVAVYDQPSQLVPAPTSSVGPGSTGGFTRGPMMIPESRSITVSWWSALVAALLLPALWTATYGVRAVRPRRADRTNCCPKCFYDLRATPQRCPECGYVPEARM